MGKYRDGDYRVLLQCGECIGYLEIKCPYSKEDITILEAVKRDKKIFLEVNYFLPGIKKMSCIFLPMSGHC